MPIVKDAKRIVVFGKDESLINKLQEAVHYHQGLKVEWAEDYWLIFDKRKQTDLFIIDADSFPYIRNIPDIFHMLPPILVLSNRSRGSFVCGLLKMGVSGFISKSAEHKQMAKAIESMLNYRTFLEPKLVQYLVGKLLDKSLTFPGETLNRRKLLCLSRREFEVYQLMVQGKSNHLISRKLYISEHTVKHHVHNLQKKLNAQNRTEAVTMAYREEWVTNI